MSFSNLGLSDKVLAAVAATGYTTPTPIQEQAIPHVLARRDVLGIAQTGTGKTAAFVLPMLTLLEKGRARARMPRTLILEPTRELAAQVKEQFDKYGAGQKLNVALLIGGVSFGDQDSKLMRGVDVLIATPGRLLDHTERGGLLLTGVELLVIDEADRMLDMGFIPDIERICKLVPFTRQTLFFTATMPPEISRITEAFLHNPARIEVSKPATTAVTVTQLQVPAGREAHDKREILRRLLRDAKDLNNAIIFCNRKREVAVLHKSLQKHGFSVGALHGDMDQSARTAALDQFRKGEIPLLVASDVAARGLDIPAVSHVFNFDVPHHPDDYVHRIGRTGRAGRTGTAISIVTSLDSKSMTAIEKLIGQPIPRAEGDYTVHSEGSDEDAAPRRSRSREGSRDGARGGRKPRREREPRDGEREPRHGEREARHGEREPRHGEREARREREPREERAAKPEREPRHGRNSAPQAAPSHVPSIGRAEPRRPQREVDHEPADHSHLPAFLLRPVRARA
ncbi:MULTISPECIES: DEAD/DEAH box helicase [Bradyrhizobium]|jgi:superfamily II DNA/RNA helicase|uniref:DEAD/DEAH box helicase n=1 Tax=Bradyrhizobium TaxID=374 RepID=UPI0004802BE7|nr:MULTISPECIES: DEAD/DEAH box helicase [Bradyrhizobium]MCS3449180.1 superfamily II DNA/RNA helicase [Bradyrhizobium elkanii]MCS3559677.1 superfamily II DNA/RNA helicase [Bradyrhizobium elkanii]MCW2150477.1 superfamily II DNA/RNA helicase [Bradyrhizobium elkanii]MCW2359465.1 superfamily II DNA/RNA helicase [Bradyrhizobium elkanii]MCW2374208.1 superfamily II DNA/RNA helicase [Bradyrhizobium elkanii]